MLQNMNVAVAVNFSTMLFCSNALDSFFLHYKISGFSSALGRIHNFYRMFRVLITLPVQHLHKNILLMQTRPFKVLVVCVHFYDITAFCP